MIELNGVLDFPDLELVNAGEGALGAWSSHVGQRIKGSGFEADSVAWCVHFE